MKRFLQNILSAVGLGAGHSVVTPSQFTQDFIRILKSASPGSEVQIVGDLDLKVTPPNSSEQRVFLHNAYEMYKSSPSDKEEIIKRFAAAGLEAASDSEAKLDRTRIVPIIKDQLWVEETLQVLRNRGAKADHGFVHEDFSSDLIIVYAEDTPKNIKYLTPKQLAEAGLELKDLRPLACENLRRLLPEPQRHGKDGKYMLTVGGDYEASLLLLDFVWDKQKLGVEGDIVVAIPSREMLLVTGSDNPDVVAQLRAVAKESYAKGAYRLTPKLFVRRNGSFTELSE